TEYAVETYPMPPLLLAKNVLKPVTSSTTYFNFISNDNVLSATFATWDLASGTYPRPLDTYVYKTDIVNHETGEFSFTPYSPFAANAPEWQKIEADIIQYDNDGQATLNRRNQQYIKTTVGYDRSIAKASFISVEGEFDATYTGFEDLPAASDIPIGSLPYPEHWYGQDISLVEIGKNANIIAVPTSDNYIYPPGFFCGNEVEIALDLGPGAVYLLIPDNDYLDGQMFHIGDEVTISGSYGGGTSLPVVETTISSFITSGSNIKLCFNDPLPAAYGDAWDNYIEVKVTKKIPVVQSGPSTAYKRTGGYSYRLISKKSSGENTRKTPVRPLKIPLNTLKSYPTVCHIYSGGGGNSKSVKGAYPEICYTNYEASVWLRHDLELPVMKAADEFELPDGVSNPCDPVTAAHRQVDYIRGTLSDSPTDLPVRIVYRVWNNSRTTVIDEGVFYPENVENKWKQYTVEIPLFRGGENNQLDVYIESDIVDTRDYKTRKNIYVDDLLIYPQNAKYTYMSMDKFQKQTHAVDNNDVFIAQRQDEWGRKSMIWNAYGKQTHQYTYQVTDLPYQDNAITETVWTSPSQYFRTRNYTDGFGKPVQSVVSDHTTDKKIILSSTEYNAMGWPAKVYKSYSRKGCNLVDKHDASYASKVSDLYDSDHAFQQFNYVVSLEKFPQSILNAREDTEDERAIYTLRARNTSVVGGTYGIPVYTIGKLEVLEETDAGDNKIRTFTDDFGRVVLKEVEPGNDYTDNPDGTISFLATEMPVAQTWFQYDHTGRLIRTVDPDGKETKYYYNSIGQQIKSAIPDRGVTEMRYDLFGQLRFSKSAKDQATISDAGVIDQFKYVKYDKWGRPVAGGMMREMSSSPLTNALGEVYDPLVRFDDVTTINDQAFPEDGVMFNQINHRYQYDGTRATYSSNSLLTATTYSGHTLNADYQFVADKEDAETSAYRADGLLVSKSYDYDEFSIPHVFNYLYNSMGLLTRKESEHASDNTFDFRWDISYDNFGRPKNSKAGKSGDIALSSSNYYDGLGNLYKTGLGSGTGDYGPHMDFVAYKWNIRDELVSKMSHQFRLGLAYDKSGLISDQYWSSEHFDSTEITSADLNHYHYYYDKMQRLVGADYRRQNFTSNPFAYFETLAATEENEFSCGLEISEYAEYFTGVVDEITTYSGFSQADKRLVLEAVKAISFIEETYLSSQQDWLKMTEQQQSGLMKNIWQQSTRADVDLKAYERLTAIMKEDQQHIQLLDQQGQTSQYNDRIYKYAKNLIDYAVVTASVNCKTNYGGTVYGYLPDFSTDGVATNPAIYDAAYWYTGNGNTNLLHRKDDLGVLTTQTYGYAAPTNNLLTSVNWNVGGVINATAYDYDELGNLLFDEQNDNTIGYEFFTDLPVSITNVEGVKQYRYNSEGMRSVKNKDGDIEYYLDGIILDADEKVSAYQAGEGYVTIWEDGSLHGFYTIKDWLGTTRVTLNKDGEITSSRDHYPYGKTMPGRVLETDEEGKRYQFTGHEFDEEVNYGYHGARYYNRELGRYLSVDPLMANYPHQSVFAYANDNPVMFIDP
ncbi:MAG: RHS repeat-associated core domain-containing protein, partial [Cyclobacteriaceae bacterium]